MRLSLAARLLGTGAEINEDFHHALHQFHVLLLRANGLGTLDPAICRQAFARGGGLVDLGYSQLSAAISVEFRYESVAKLSTASVVSVLPNPCALHVSLVTFASARSDAHTQSSSNC